MSQIKVTLQERKSKKKSRAVTIHSNIYVRCELWGRGPSQFLLEGCGTASFPKRSLLTTIFHRKKKKKETQQQDSKQGASSGGIKRPVCDSLQTDAAAL